MSDLRSGRLAILLWATDPDQPALCATPFFHALAASALDVQVEVHFTARSVLLLDPGRAQRLRAAESEPTTVYDHMRAASQAGVQFFACSAALAANRLDAAALIPECSGIRGVTSFVDRVLDPAWRTLTF